MSDSFSEVLIIEDSAADVDFILHASKIKKYSVSLKVVQDGEEALEFLFRQGKYRQLPPVFLKFILLDIKLPRMSGVEILLRIKSAPQALNIPVIIFTSSVEQRDIEGCYRIGANSYVVKPADFNRFMQTIHDIFDYWLKVNQSPFGSA